MAETYDSVLDRIGAFNAATEALSKGRAREIRCDVPSRPGSWLLLAKSEGNYCISLPADAVLEVQVGALSTMGFRLQGDLFVREVRKVERSWTVASQLEDILADAMGLPSDVAIAVETSAG
ncbi:MAG TPA: hypothetical protein VFS62_08310 [Chloroflexota bacterium]|nr:hypothetical protein [Chloroflexota bacterium]